MQKLRSNSIPLKGILIWSLSTLFFLYEFFLRTVIGTFQHSFMADMHITYLQFSLISTTLFVLIYGIMQIPVGILIYKIGFKKSLLIGSILATISTLAFSLSSNFIASAISKVLMSFGASFGFICVLTSIHQWIPKKHIALFIGLTQFIGSLGPMFAAGPMQSLCLATFISWRTTFIYLSLIGAILSILIFFFVQNNEQWQEDKSLFYKTKTSKIFCLSNIFKNLQPLYIGAVSATLYFTLEYLSENETLLISTIKRHPLAL